MMAEGSGVSVANGSFWPRLYLGLSLALAFLYAAHPIGVGEDFWAHAAVGRWICAHGGVPRHTLFLWTNNSSEWVAHAWLTQVCYYGLMRAGGEKDGPLLAALFTGLMVALSYYLVWRCWARRARVTVLTPIVFALGMRSSVLFYSARPQLFSSVFLVLLLTFLIRRQDLPRTGDKRIWLLPLLFVAWANFHGGFAVGLVLLTIIALCDLVQDKGLPRSRALLGACGACWLAAMISPYGVHVWASLRAVSSPLATALISEWKPAYAPPYLPWQFTGGAALLLELALMAWMLNPQRRYSQFGWLVAMALAFLQARRQLWVLVLTSLAVMAANAEFLDTGLRWNEFWKARGVPKITRRWSLVSHALAALAIVAFLLEYRPWRLWPPRGEEPLVPHRMVAYLHDHPPAQPVFNGLDDSSYLLWALNGNPPLYINIFNESYPPALLGDWHDIVLAGPRGRELLHRDGIRTVIMGHRAENDPETALVRYLDRDASWAHVYHADDGDVWTR